MLGVNMGMDMEMLMLGMLESFDRCNVRGECGNERMVWMNARISGVNVEIGEC